MPGITLEPSPESYHDSLREQNRRLRRENAYLRDCATLCVRWQMLAAEYLRERDGLKRKLGERAEDKSE